MRVLPGYHKNEQLPNIMISTQCSRVLDNYIGQNIQSCFEIGAPIGLGAAEGPPTKNNKNKQIKKKQMLIGFC